MYWGFLIFSLLLQAVVISLTYGYKTKNKVANEKNEDDFKMVVNEKSEIDNEIKRNDRFLRLTKILKQYSGIVLIAQIAYHLINDENFLSSYGWDTLMKDFLKSNGINEKYLGIIGFHEYDKSQASSGLIWLFLSPIIFYITTSIMKDHFSEKLVRLNKIKEDKVEEAKKKDELHAT